MEVITNSQLLNNSPNRLDSGGAAGYNPNTQHCSPHTTPHNINHCVHADSNDMFASLLSPSQRYQSPVHRRHGSNSYRPSSRRTGSTRSEAATPTLKKWPGQESCPTPQRFYRNSTPGSFGTPSPRARQRPSSGSRRLTAENGLMGSPSYASGSSGDRFIPNRKSANRAFQLHCANDINFRQADQSSGLSPPPSRQQEFNGTLAKTLLEGDVLKSRVLNFGNSPVKLHCPESMQLRDHVDFNRTNLRSPRKGRVVQPTPLRILDAPDLVDDYYLNLLDWSCNNILAVGLRSSLYLWNASTGDIKLLVDNPEGTFVTSLRWMADGTHIALGNTNNQVQIWDIEANKMVRRMAGHVARVSALAWSEHLLSSGSRDSHVHHHDVRIAQHQIGVLTGHTEEICGLQWSLDGASLASGGNDNTCMIWDRRTMNGAVPQHSFKQRAAVKAMAWCPFQRGLLATGGGTADRHIRFYNTQSGKCVSSIDTKSQVCSLVWSPRNKEILSAHGFSMNQLTIWKYPSMTKIASLTGHSSRVLHTALSPDGTTICSAAADETLRFWKVWEPESKKKVDMAGALNSPRIR